MFRLPLRARRRRGPRGSRARAGSRARPRWVGLTSDQGVWFVDFAGSFLGRLDPGADAVEEIPLPGGSRSQPCGMVVDRHDRIWLVETAVRPNRFIGYDTRSSEFIGEADIPSGGGSVRHICYDEDQEVVWFGTDANTFGRATLP